MKKTEIDIIVAGTAAIMAKKKLYIFNAIQSFFFNFRTVVETLELQRAMKTTALDIIVAGTAAIIAKKKLYIFKAIQSFFFQFQNSS